MSAVARRARGLAGLVPGLALGLAGAVLYGVPLNVWRLDPPVPILALVAVFAWALARPGLASALATFALGLVYDITTGGPAGVWALGFTAAYAAAWAQRAALSGQNAGAVWMGFALSAIACAIAAGIGGALARGAAPLVGVLSADIAATIALAPIVARLFGGLSSLAQAAVETP